MQDEKRLSEIIRHEAGSLSSRAEARYLQSIKDAGRRPKAIGIFKVRMMANLTAVHVLMAVSGQQNHAETEKVYQALYEKALRGLKLRDRDCREAAKGLLRDQIGAFNAELKSDGAGHFAMAVVYQEALKDSLGAVDKQGAALLASLEEMIGQAVREFFVAWTQLAKTLGLETTRQAMLSDETAKKILEGRLE